jgi:hypothetical protein
VLLAFFAAHLDEELELLEGLLDRANGIDDGLRGLQLLDEPLALLRLVPEVRRVLELLDLRETARLRGEVKDSP